jgi:hypothetical protein
MRARSAKSESNRPARVLQTVIVVRQGRLTKLGWTASNTAPGPFSMASEVRTRALLADTGFTAVRTEHVSLSLPQGEREAITAQPKEAFARFLTDRRYELPDVSLDAVAS